MEFYCTCCGEKCEVVVVDNGIGRYEFWGAKGVDVRYDIETACCGFDPVDEDGNAITLDDYNFFMADSF